MVSKIRSRAITSLIHFFIVFLVVMGSITVSAQCAGNDNWAPDVCDIPNVSSQSINLFSYLGGSPLTGGTWKDDNRSGGLNTATGILNAQIIKSSGIYRYTYTVNNGVGCTDNTATITIIIGGYPGVGSIGNACKDDPAYNLFQVFDSRTLDPQINGIWHDDDNSGVLTDNILDARTLVVDKTYHFTYTMPAIGSCSEKSVTVQVAIKEPANSGAPINLELCSDELSPYTNYNLNNSLAGEDPNGTWSELSGTNEITGLLDTSINIENIYNTFGPGKYSFAYTVLSKNRICPHRTSIVEITIEKKLDYTGATLVVGTDICENEIMSAAPTYPAVLTQGAQIVPNGTYNVTYTVSGVLSPITVTANFTNGVFNFDISSAFFQHVGNYTIQITNIVSKTTLDICTNVVGTIYDVFHVYPTPKINSATLKIDPVCQNSDAWVELSGTSNLTDGDYDIKYQLSGNNSSSITSIRINVSSGKALFMIPKQLIPNEGSTKIAILNITNTATNCSNTSTLMGNLVVKALPNITAMAVVIKDICQNQPATVQLSGLGTLTTISLSYTLSGSNSVLTQTLPLVVTAGKTSFEIPANAVPNLGLTSFSITDLTNIGNSCSAIINPNSKNFTINAIPSNPTASNQEFCKTDLVTVANLVPNGNQYNWYDTATSTTPLASSTPLVTANYYVKEINRTTTCESGATPISVLINTVPLPVLKLNGQKFCGVDKPTIQNLSNNTTVSGNLKWYDAASNGRLFGNTDLLEEGVTYYGFDYSTIIPCHSSDLAVTVTLTDCIATPYNFMIPDGFSPNGDGVNETFYIKDIEFIYPNYTLEIFNRYGNVLFKGDSNKPAWDGKNSSSNFINGDSPTGVYFYIINYNKDSLSPKQGQLYLNR
jgi:gliding motility-associated-like protein